MITSGELYVFDSTIGCDTLVHYDLLPVEGADRLQVYLYDNLFHYLGAHEFSGVSFRKCPDYWISMIYDSLSSGSIEDDGWTVSPHSPNFAPWRENGEWEKPSQCSTIDDPVKGGRDG